MAYWRKLGRYFSASVEMVSRSEVGRRTRRAATSEQSISPALKPVEPLLVSSVEGKICGLLLTIPDYATETAAYRGAYQRLLGALPDSVQLTIVCHEGTNHNIMSWLRTVQRNSLRIVPVQRHLHFTVWAQDAFAVSIDRSNQQRHFLEPRGFSRDADDMVPDLAKNAETVTPVPLFFEGGNILIGDDFWFLGGDYPERSLEFVGEAIWLEEGERPRQLVRRLYSTYLDTQRRLIYVYSKRRVPPESLHLSIEKKRAIVNWVYVGNDAASRQPIFHIDMFVTLAGRGSDGRYRVLVGDPGMASEALGIPPAPYAMQRIFDDIANSLGRRFAVIRNPLPLVYQEQEVGVDEFAELDSRIHEELRSRRLETAFLRKWYFASANNALVQNTSSARAVWLPTYGHDEFEALRTTDALNADIWRRLGFEVRELGNFHAFAVDLGAVHCITKYLNRT